MSASALHLRPLHLRPLCDADALVMAGWTEDEVFCRHAGWPVKSVESIRAFWKRQVDDPPSDPIRLAFDNADNGLVGYVDLHGTDPKQKELGFVVGPSRRWGHGFGRRLAEAGLAYGFGEISLDCIWAEALVANAASVRILRSLGMSETGRGTPGQFLQIDSCQLQFRISRQEWRQDPN